YPARRATYPDGRIRTLIPGRLPLAREKPVPSLFGLAPGGVCRAACVAADAVRSYRTVSPLPACRSFILPRKRRRLGRGRAVCSLWHFPWARARRTLSGTACPWSPDFPPGPTFRHRPERPSGRLTPNGWG